MANNFKNASVQNVGTAWSTIYTCPALSTAVVIGMSITNKLGTTITCQSRIYDNDNGGQLSDIISPNTPIEVGGALVPVGGDQKLVLEAGDRIDVMVSDDLSSDVVMSILEIS